MRNAFATASLACLLGACSQGDPALGSYHQMLGSANVLSKMCGVHPKKLASADALTAFRRPKPKAQPQCIIPPSKLARLDSSRGVMHSVTRSGSNPRAARISVGTTAADGFEIGDPRSGITVHATVKGASSASLELIDGFITYAGALGSTDWLQRVTELGIEDFFYVEDKAQSNVEYMITVPPSVGLRLVENNLEVVDRQGVPRLRVGHAKLVARDGTRRDVKLNTDCDADRKRTAPWGRPITRPKRGDCTVTLSWDTAGLKYPLLVDPAWETTASLVNGTDTYTLTRLRSGVLLRAGGLSTEFPDPPLDSPEADLFDPATETWAETGFMNLPRAGHTATLLTLDNVGKVLVTGGYTVDGESVTLTASTDIYDPDTGDWTAGNDMGTARTQHTATETSAGVLIVGGAVGDVSYPLDATDTTELYDETYGTFSSDATLNHRRFGHTASVVTRDSENHVLVVGGWYLDDGWPGLTTSEYYDGTWHYTSNEMSQARGDHSAIVLPNGKVVVVGGDTADGWDLEYATDAEIYDHSTEEWASAGTIEPAAYMGASLVSNGNLTTIVAAGGLYYEVLDQVQLYDPIENEWYATTSLNEARAFVPAATLPDNRVMIASGLDVSAANDLNSTEIFTFNARASSCDHNVECASGVCGAGDVCTAVFQPVTCTPCEAGTDPIYFKYDTRQEFAPDQNCDPEVSDCPTYQNFLSDRRQLFANKFVTSIGIRVDDLATQTLIDTLSFGPAEDHYTISGFVPNGWVDSNADTGKSFQSDPAIFNFDTNGSVNYRGVDVGEARVCCTNEETLHGDDDVEIPTGLRQMGLLLGSNDVVYFRAHVDCTGESEQHVDDTFALFPNAPFATPDNRSPAPEIIPTTDFDMYVACDRRPIPTDYDYASVTHDSSFEFIHIPAGNCGCDKDWYVAVNSAAGRGTFNLVRSVHWQSQHYGPGGGHSSLRAGTSTIRSDTDAIQQALAAGAAGLFSASEGTRYLEQIDFWNSGDCEDCGGEHCDICFVEAVDSDTSSGQSHIGYAVLDLLPDNGIAHELTHLLLGVLDEYTCGSPPCNSPPQDPDFHFGSQCGHSIMGYDKARNWCYSYDPEDPQHHDHAEDYLPSPGPTALDAVWTTAANDSPWQPETTPDSYWYAPTNFNGAVGYVVSH